MKPRSLPPRGSWRDRFDRALTGRPFEGGLPVRVTGGSERPHDVPRPTGWEYRPHCKVCVFCAVERAARELEAFREQAA